MLVLMLEDDRDRLQRFARILHQHNGSLEFRHWRTAESFIDGFKSITQDPCLICLDHDLFAYSPDEPDPGDGRDVARFLAQNKPCCHIIIHSSNSYAADSMLYTLLDAGWDAEKIAPLGSDWIESFWWPTAKPWLTI